METPKSEAAPSSSSDYVWTSPDHGVSIHLELRVIDRMLPEIMRGFGAVPRRGAEVGGILIGTVECAHPLTVRVNDFEIVPCEHERGPSFVLSARDREAWLEALERLRRVPGREAYAIGYYRSHTRDGLALAPEDLSMMAEFFPAPHEIALLVKPFASRASLAGFFFYEEGSIRAEATYAEFPFRARDLPARPALSLAEVPPRAQEAAGGAVEAQGFSDATPAFEEKEVPLPGFLRVSKVPRRNPFRWLWAIPLGLALVAGGAFVGVYYALGADRQIDFFQTHNPYNLELSFTTAADNVHLSWNREAPVIRSADRGVLTITDGVLMRNVELGRGQLQNGSVVYRHISMDVNFKLEIFIGERNSVAESLEVHLRPAESR